MMERIVTRGCISAALALLLVLPLVSIGTEAQAPREGEKKPLPLEEIQLPEGFEISLYAEGVVNARAMARSPKGVLFVGTRTDGRVWAVVDEDGDHQADRVVQVAEDLLMPSGLAYHDGALWVAEVHQIWRYEGIEDAVLGKGEIPPPKLAVEGLPKIRHHGWKFIAFGPDGKLYVPVGAPCNLCQSKDPIFDTILRMNPDGSEREIVARGVRNTVGFDWHPETGQLWFTDNGRDWWGNERPPDELNVVSKVGEHFGYPHCHGTGLADDVFGGPDHPCSKFTDPVQDLGPHVAAIGMRFYTGESFPERYHHQPFIAEHGSWNRTEPIGYRVTVVPLKEGNSLGYEAFASGWLKDNGRPWGRPADVLVMPDGSLLVSDDLAGVIYRIRYTG